MTLIKINKFVQVVQDRCYSWTTDVKWEEIIIDELEIDYDVAIMQDGKMNGPNS